MNSEQRTKLALARANKAKTLPLPKICGGVLTVSLRLVDMLAIEPHLVRDEDARVVAALIQEWRAVRGRVADGTLNPITWLDDSLCELGGMHWWIPAVFLKRLRQLQRSELRLETEAGQRIIPVANHGVPEALLLAAGAIGMRVSIVRRLNGGYEDLTTRLDATVAVDGLCAAWHARPNDEFEASEFLTAAARDCGWRISP